MLVDKNKVHSTHAYLTFDKIVKIIEENLKEKVFSFGSYDSTIVFKRIIQRIVVLTLNPFVYLCNKKIESDDFTFTRIEKKYVLSGLLLNTENGNVEISPTLFLRLCAEFFYEWIRMLVAILLGFITVNSKERKPATLVFGVGDEVIECNSGNKRFIEFCREGPIEPLNNARWLIVEYKGTPIEGDRTHQYVGCPVKWLVLNSGISFIERASLLLRQLLIPVKYFIAVFQFPLISLLGRDIALVPVIEFFDKKNLIQNIIITNSNYSCQQLWMRKSENCSFRVHEVLYSQNTKPFVYTHDELKSDLPLFRHVAVDEHWVWTEGYKNYLRELGQKGKIHVVGSIMFYLPKKTPLNKHNEFRIGVFDITPVYSEVANKIGIINNYYNTSTMIEFLRNITLACKEIENKLNKKIIIQLKHKRSYNKSHDEEYIKYCKNLKNDNVIEIIDSNVDVYQFVRECSLVISVPYTSAAYIATEMGTPSIYYDCTSELLPTYERRDKLSMVSTYMNLCKKLKVQLNT